MPWGRCYFENKAPASVEVGPDNFWNIVAVAVKSINAITSTVSSLDTAVFTGSYSFTGCLMPMCWYW